MIYQYMIMYKFQGGEGRWFVDRDKKIESAKDVLDVDEFMRSKNSNINLPEALKKSVYVSDFKLLNIKLTKEN